MKRNEKEKEAFWELLHFKLIQFKVEIIYLKEANKEPLDNGKKQTPQYTPTAQLQKYILYVLEKLNWMQN